MSKTRILFTPEQDIWLYNNSRAKKWSSNDEFVNAFNDKFGVSKSLGSVTGHMRRCNMPHIDCITTDINNSWKPEYRKWIEDNLNTGVFRDKKHFLKVFNAVFNENKSFDSLAQYLSKNNLTIATPHTVKHYTDEQDKWLKENCSKYEVFSDLVVAYNMKFGTAKNYSQLSSRCKVLGVRQYDAKRRTNRGNFKKGQKYGAEECPLNTIRYDKQRNMCFIKVQMCEGKSRETSGHNLKAPFWKILQNKIWEDNYGYIPDGYVACSLTDDPYEQNIENIALIDKRGKAIMGRKEWWSDNAKFTNTAVQWCNLYFVAKDNGVYAETN